MDEPAHDREGGRTLDLSIHHIVGLTPFGGHGTFFATLKRELA